MMKKSSKISIFILTLAILIAGVFVTVALADGGAEQASPVGSYTAPEGAWTPSGSIAYAVFASEQDYLSGAEPISTSTNAELTSSVTSQLGNVYMVLFSDVTYTNAGGQEGVLAAKQTLTVNLAGHTLTPKTKVRVSAQNNLSTLIIENGTLHNTGNQLQVDRNASFILKNVVFNARQIGYNSGAALMHFIDCEITVIGTMPIYLGSHATAKPGEVIFENTDLTLTSAGIATSVANTTSMSNNAIITILFNESNACRWNIVFDENSSISCPNMTEAPIWFSIVETVGIPNGQVPKVIFEKGFTFDSVSTPNFKYTSRPLGTTTYIMNNDPDALKVDLIVSDPDSLEASNEWAVGATEDGRFTFVTPEWAWALYANEQAYVGGATPLLASEEAVLDPADLAAYSEFFLRAFKDVTLDHDGAAPIFGGATSAVVDLNGLSLASAAPVALLKDGSSASLTVRNGKLNVAGALTVGDGCSLELSSVTLDAASVGNSAFASLSLLNSSATLTSATPVIVGASASGSTVTVTNTDIILTSDSFAASAEGTVDLVNNGIITVVGEGSDWGAVSVKLAANSSIRSTAATSVPTWVSVSANGAIPESAKITVYIESGFSFSEKLTPDFKYTYSVGNGYSAADCAKDATVNMSVVIPGTTEAVASYQLILLGEGMYTFDTLAWALYTNEQAYLAGEAPILESADVALYNTITNTLTGEYLRIYKDVTFANRSGENFLRSGQTLVIDLGGNTITPSTKIRVSAANVPAYLTVKNGTIANNNQFQLDRGTRVIFENVVYNGNQFGYNSGVSYLHFTDCELNLASNMPFYFGPHAKGIGSAEVIFESTTVNMTGSNIATSHTEMSSWSNNAIFGIYYNEDYNCNWRITIDKDSVFNCVNMKKSPILLSVLSVKNIPAGDVPTVIIEQGAAFNINSIPQFTYATKGVSAPSYVPEGDPLAIECDIKFVNPETGEAVEGTLFANPTETGNVYSITTEKDKSGNTVWYVYSEGAELVIGAPATYMEGVELPVLTVSAMRSFPAGSRIELLCDLSVYVTAGEKYLNNFANGLTLDLGGNTLYCNNRIDFGYHDGKSWRESHFTVKNGNIVADAVDYLFFGLPTEAGSLTLESLNIKQTRVSSNNSVVHTYNGSLTVKDCVLSSEARIFTPESGGLYPTVTFENTVMVSKGTAVEIPANSTGATSFSFIGCDITSDVTAISIRKNASGFTAGLNLVVKGSRLKAASCVSIASDATASVSVTLSETWLSSKVTLPAGHVLTLGEGEAEMTIANSDYAYRVTAPDVPLMSNLKLYSDLVLYFYVPKDTNVVSITVDGVTYNVEELDKTLDIFGRGEHYVLELASLNPDVAADTVWYSVCFMKDGVLHTATLGYSVLDYVEALLATDYSNKVKQLAVSAVEYVAAAYAKAGKSSEELDAFRLVESYIAVKPELIAPTGSTAALGDASVAISSMQLDLGATMKVRLNLTASYSGALTVLDREYVVTEGKVGELSYVELSLPAHEMFSTVITVSASGASGTLDLAGYALAVAGSAEYTDLDRALVAAYYSYCAYAYEYASISSNN